MLGRFPHGLQELDELDEELDDEADEEDDCDDDEDGDDMVGRGPDDEEDDCDDDCDDDEDDEEDEDDDGRCDDMDEGRAEGRYTYCWPPVAMSSSSSVNSIAPAGFSGSCACSSSLMDCRKSGSFHARMILSCNIDIPPYARNSRSALGCARIGTSDPSVVP